MKKISFVIILIVLAVFSHFNTFEEVDNLLKDSMYQQTQPADSRIVIIGIDDDSLKAIGKWPWDRSIHAAFIEIVESGNPAVLGLDIIFSEDDQIESEDNRLSETLMVQDNIVMPVVGIFGESVRANEVETKGLLSPVLDLGSQTRLGHINVIPDNDGIVRHALMMLSYDSMTYNSFSWEIYLEYLENTDLESSKTELPLDDFNRMYIDYSGKPDDMEYISYYRILDGSVPAAYLKDKIVLVGATAVGIGDYYTTSIDRQIPMYGIEIHANIIRNLMNNLLKTEVSGWVEGVILFVIGLVAVFFSVQYQVAWSTLFNLILAVVYFFGARWSYRMGWVVDIIYPLIFIGIIYIVNIIIDFFSERQQKQQVRNMFGRYVSEEVVKEIIDKGESGLKIGGETKEATFIFVDIRNFTTLSEKMTSDETVSIVNQCLDIFATAIIGHQGTLDKFIGDAAMGIFNAPHSMEDHAYQAVLAAWEMKERGKVLETQLYEKYGQKIGFGIGINTGEAVIGNFGTEFRMDYTAIGDSVNTASRLEGVAKANQILISESTLNKVKDLVEIEMVGEISVKGKDIQIKTYEVKGVKNVD
jgi:adenylate cyclase